MSEWQPIETAPKDRDVLVYALAKVWTHSVPFFWIGQAGWDEPSLSWWTTCYAEDGSELIVNPTHWMPLPAPPEV